MKLYVIVPAFNEARTVYTLLTKVIRTNLAQLGLEMHVIVVDDGSTDGTPREIERLMQDHPEAPITRLRLDQNHGKGYAIREGLKHCVDDEGIVLIQDADLEYSPEQYPLLLRPIVTGVTRVVYGSRRIKPGMLSKSGLLYSLGGWLENLYLKCLYRTNISDIATGYKAMPAGLLKSLNLKAEGFEFCPEVTAKLLNRGIPVIEIPIAYQARKKREGKKIKWTDFFIGVKTLTRVRLLKE